MSDEARRQAEELVARWRSGTSVDSPAGPLFASGEYAESDITSPTPAAGTCGTNCTNSGKKYCC